MVGSGVVNVNEDKRKDVVHYIIVVIAVVLGILVLYVPCAREGVQDNRIGADDVRNKIEQAGRTQQTITGGLEEAAAGAGYITAGIERGEAALGKADDAADRLETGLTESGKLIGECQQIVGRVRARGEAQGKNN